MIIWPKRDTLVLVKNKQTNKQKNYVKHNIYFSECDKISFLFIAFPSSNPYFKNYICV